MAVSNQDARRNSGAANEAARRATGQANQDSRRGGGAAMVERRTGKAQAADVNALVVPPRQRRALRAVEPRGALPAQRGVGAYQAPAASGGGLASPVTEPSYAAREYWPTGLVSSDGLFFLPAPKKIVMEDANGLPAQFEYANPVSP